MPGRCESFQKCLSALRQQARLRDNRAGDCRSTMGILQRDAVVAIVACGQAAVPNRPHEAIGNLPYGRFWFPIATGRQ